MKDQHDTHTPDLLGAAAPDRRGRPAVYPDAAARQAAYRARLKERGMVEVRRVVPIAPKPPQSKVLDLSEVRRWPARTR